MGEDSSWGTTTRALAEAGGNVSAAVLLGPGTILGGRFRVISRIGAGGMGVVYRAHDSKLSRDVAIKVHALDSGAARLEREATAMAQLSHANVVTVYEVGTHEDAVFIAMELVDGETARAWRARGQRSWRDVVRLYLAAGDGLVALHRAGLVHRDFKPDNVLVGSDGRVRVADLGLARTTGTTIRGGDGAVESGLATGIAGTKAYMSPEQGAGAPVDERTDQYAFAAALSEALRDLRPPRRIRRALARGCAADRDARWPTLQALLDRLAYDPRPRLVAMVVAVVVIGALAFSVDAARRRAPCRGGGQRFSRAWSPALAQHVHDALVATGIPDAALQWTQTQKALDTYQRYWIDSYTNACEATRVHRDQSEDLLDRRMICLESRLEETAALTAILTHADVATAKKASDAAKALTPVAGCNDVVALKAIVPLPADPALRARVAAVRAQIDRAKPIGELGRWSEAKAALASALAEAHVLGYRPLIADAAMSLALQQLSLGLDKESEASAREAAFAGEASHDDVTAAAAWVHLVFVVGFQEARGAEGHELVRVAEAALARLPTPNRDLEAELLDWRSSLALRESKVQEAIALSERALAIRRQLFGDSDMRVPQQMYNLAISMIGDADVSLPYNERALALMQEALAMDVRLLGPEHPDVGMMHAGVGEALHYVGRFADAETEYARALEIAEKKIGPNNERVASFLAARADNRAFLADCSGAIALMARAVDILNHVFAPDHVDIASTEGGLAWYLNQCKRYDEALTHAEHSLAILLKRDPDEDEVRAYTAIGNAQLGLGHRDKAIEAFTRALELDKHHPLFQNIAASARFGLARALPSSEHARAVALAQQARAQFVKMPLHYHRERDAIDAWLASRR